MLTHALGSPARFGVLTLLCLMLAGCASTQLPIVCGGAAGAAQCVNPNLWLYATTTSNQVLPFSISSATGALTPLTPAAGPANSGSIANLGFVLMFGDPSTNQVDSDQVSPGSGTLMAVPGSPFPLGTANANGGPTGILSTAYGLFYASEPDGTIVGFSTPGDGTLTTPVPNSPFAAGGAPAQLASAALLTTLGGNALYAADSANLDGGILAYTFGSSGSLTPVPGSPFLALPNSEAGSILVASSYLLVSVTSFPGPTNLGYVAVLLIDQNTGGLTPVPGSPFAVGNAPASMAQDSSNHLFVLSGADHTISAFNVESNGMLTAIGTPVAAGTATGGMVPFPPYLYVADTNASSILTFMIDPTTGALTTPARSTTVSSPPLQLTSVNFPAI